MTVEYDKARTEQYSDDGIIVVSNRNKTVSCQGNLTRFILLHMSFKNSIFRK